jgi:hypothetical protein
LETDLRYHQSYIQTKNASVVTEEDIRLGLEHAHALFEDTKTLFEALTKKGG